jgi:hypothetical protein
MTRTDIEQLRQLFHAHVTDGVPDSNVLSKVSIARLHRDGLATRHNGWNTITPAGESRLRDLGIIR